MHCMLIKWLLDLSDFLGRLHHIYLRKAIDGLVFRQLSAVVDLCRSDSYIRRVVVESLYYINIIHLLDRNDAENIT
jgi:hypothetical protein